MPDVIPSRLNRFLTVWLSLDAVLNAACGIGYFFFPRAFFAGISGPYGDDVTPNLVWTVRTQASYFLLASGAMITAARSRDPQLRRRLLAAFTLPGLLQIPAAIIRGTQEGASWRTSLVSTAIVCFICAPYVTFLIKKEEDAAKAWWSRKGAVHNAQDGTSQ